MNILQKTLRNRSFWALALAGIILFTASCEVIKSDVKKDFKLGQVDAYKIQGGNFVIDLDAVYPNSNYLGARSDISADLNVIQSRGRKYLIYQPKKGVDEEFDIELESQNGETQVASVQFQNRSLAPCGNAKNFTEATISNDSKLVVDLLENEDFCGLKDMYSGALTSNISVDSSAFEKSLLSMGGDGPGRLGWLTYTFDPVDDFTGVVEFEYVAGANFDSEAADTLRPELTNYPEIFEYFTHHTARITVTD